MWMAAWPQGAMRVGMGTRARASWSKYVEQCLLCVEGAVRIVDRTKLQGFRGDAKRAS